MERLHEKYIDTWLLNLNLQSGLKLWQKNPNSEEFAKKIATPLGWGVRQDGVVIKIKASAVERYREEGITITSSLAHEHGIFEGKNVVFESSRELMPRIGFIKGKSYLMFDRAGGPTYAFFSPDDVESIASK